MIISIKKSISFLGKISWIISIATISLLMIREYRPLGIPLTQYFLFISILLNIDKFIRRRYLPIERSLLVLYGFFLIITIIDLFRVVTIVDYQYPLKLLLLIISFIGYVQLIELYGYKLFVKILLISSTVLLIFLIYRSYFVLHANWLSIHPTIKTREGKNQLAFFISFMLPLLLWHFKNYDSIKQKILFYLMLIVHIVAIIYVQSRGVLFSFIISLLVTLFVYKRIVVVSINKFVYILATTSFVVFFFLYQNIIDLSYFFIKIKSVFGLVEGQASTDERKELLSEALEIFKNNPLFGVGTNNFVEITGKATHNTYFQIIAENGIFGFILLMSFLLLLYIKFQRRNNQPTTYYFANVNLFWNLILYLFVINGFFNAISIVVFAMFSVYERNKYLNE